MPPVRVRFAPSPTGPLHIGGVRTALFNYLFARKNKGVFILRIEDTDQNRWVEGAENYISETLEWLGIPPDESPQKGGLFKPYRQSERKEIYQEYIPKLLESGYAYYAFDTPEELEKLRKDEEAQGKVFSYNAQVRETLHNSLQMTVEELEEKLLNHSQYVIRFKMPAHEEILVDDLIRGSFKVNSQELDDKVLVKADGMPTYHFANIIDDYLMQITHVIRGEEWLPSLPLHLLLYRAMGWNPPQFAHLPLINKPEGNGKLSKRDGAQLGFPVFPMEWKEDKETYLGFKELGYYPETLINFLAGLGWTPQPENEILSLEELSQQFELEKVHKSGARFDIKKAEHINKEVLHSLTAEQILPDYLQQLSFWKINADSVDALAVIKVMKDRVSFLHSLVSESLFFYVAPKAYNAELVKKAVKENTPALLQEFLSQISSATFTTSHDWENALKQFVAEKEMGMGNLMMPLRLALVGEMKGPDIPVIMEILGMEESRDRIDYFSRFIPSM